MITGVNFAITGKTCTANLTGTLHWTHNNTGSHLTLTSANTLAATNVTGCTGVINNGDTFTYKVDGTMGYEGRDVVITSP